MRIDIEHIERRGVYPATRVLRKGGMRQEVPLPYRAYFAVEQLLDELGEQGHTSGPVFRTVRHGRRMTRNDAYWVVRNIATRAGVDTRGVIHPHSLRHSWTTISLDHGASLRDVQHSGGWKSIRMVDHYDRNRESLARNVSHLVAAAIEAS